jgi:FixJ family two-component response regulator
MEMVELQNVKVSEALLADVLKAASAQNKSVEEVVQEALQAHVRDREWREMIEEARERTARLGIHEDDVNHLIAQSRTENRRRGT